MAILTGRLEIAKVGSNQYEVRFGQPGWSEGDSSMLYSVEFVAEDFSNIGMRNWPPEPVDDKRYRIENERVYGFPFDSFAAEGLSEVMMELAATEDNLAPYFSAYYKDETVEPPAEEELIAKVTEVTVTKKNRGWQFALGFGGGGGTVTGATTKSLWKSFLATAISAGAGYGIGSQFEYWSVE